MSLPTCRIRTYIKENNAVNKNIIKKLKYRKSNILFLYRLLSSIVLFGIESNRSSLENDKRDDENSNLNFPRRSISDT